jgi:hypothetical protein
LAAVGKRYFPGLNDKTLLRGIARYKNIGCWPVTPEINEKRLEIFHNIMCEKKELNCPIPVNDIMLRGLFPKDAK